MLLIDKKNTFHYFFILIFGRRGEREGGILRVKSDSKRSEKDFVFIRVCKYQVKQ